MSNQTDNYDPSTIEPEILEFWKKNLIYEKAKDKNKGKKKFYFLDGPPYTSGKAHLGLAWNKVLKDSVLRFLRMQKFDVWDRAGYDMHGLPIEKEVEKKLGIKHKDEIPKLGVAKYIEECRNFAIKYMHLMNEDFKRLGVWMDFENAYQPIENSYIEGEWWLLKKAHENKRLYEGLRTIGWCTKCGTALAKHELEYKIISDFSIFVKFKIKEKNEFLLVWTTTPWTIPFNLGVMANPEADYVRVKAEDEEEIWIIAKALIENVARLTEKKLEIIEELKGKELEGIKYEHPLADQIAEFKKLEKNERVHTVVLSEEYVDLSSGSGLVHLSPGTGPEDYEVGHKYGIPPFCNLSEAGVFPETMGEFSGFTAKKDDDVFIEILEKKKAIVAKTKTEHDYPHCWRCKQPIIFRATKQWFFKVEDLKEEMRKLNKKIKWVPEFAGSKSFDAWLENLRDNSITKQRYWGVPLPIWKCNKCDDYIVISSAEELKERAGKIPEDLHKPWIDGVKIKCECGSKKERIPDVLDVWIDAGSASWNCLYYPQKKELFEELFPADFILEGLDQIRGWFNLLFVASMVALHKPSFKAVYMHGFINDALGRKMSKSLGNYILPEEVIEKYGADTLRYYMIGGTNPGIDINYNFDDMKVKHKNLMLLWNLHKYLLEYGRQIEVNPSWLDNAELSMEEEFIMSKMNSSIKKTTEAFSEYRLNEVPWFIEELFLELSRGYIQLIRDKSVFGSKEEKRAILYAIYNVLMASLKLFAPIAPFITEKIYLNLKNEFNLKEESLHLFDWPECEEGKINLSLEKNMAVINDVIQAVLSARDRAHIGVRWPLSEVVVVSQNNDILEAIIDLESIIKPQTNIKKISVKNSFEKVKKEIRADYNALNRDYGDKAARIIAQISMSSPEAVFRHIEKEGERIFEIDGEMFSVKRKHLIIKTKADNYEIAEFKGGEIYLNTELSPELEAEGFAREFSRRIQNLRKKLGFKKSERIYLNVKASEKLKTAIVEHKKQIMEKIGAKEIALSEKSPEGYEHSFKEKIKVEEVEIFINRVS